MSNAVLSPGTKFKRSGVELSEIKSISGPSLSRQVIEVIELSKTDGYRKYISGNRMSGTVALKFNFTWAVYETLKTDYENKTLQNYSIEIKDSINSVISFAGLVLELSLSTQLDTSVDFDATIALNNKIYITSNGVSRIFDGTFDFTFN